MVVPVTPTPEHLEATSHVSPTTQTTWSGTHKTTGHLTDTRVRFLPLIQETSVVVLLDLAVVDWGLWVFYHHLWILCFSESTSLLEKRGS